MMLTLLEFEDVEDCLCRLPLPVNVVHLSKDALEPMDTLRNRCVNGVIMVDIHVLECPHLQRIEVDINW